MPDTKPTTLESHITLVGDGIGLGPLRPELFPLHVEWVNEPEVGWNIFGSPQSRTLAEEGTWLAHQNADPANEFWLIYARDESAWRPIGVTSLTEINARRGTASFRILIGAPGDRGKGYGSEAIQLVLGHAFGTLGLRKVVLIVFGFNERAQRVYERAGFRVTGRPRARVPRDGRYWDQVIMACLASDFLTGPLAPERNP